MTNPFDVWQAAASAPTHGARLWMAGDYEQAKQAIRMFCSKEGACFAITPMDYIYSGGEESGFVVNLINYPRFETDPKNLVTKIERLAVTLMDHLNQSSYTIEQYGSDAPQSVFYSRRKSS